jgi:hypothetical protein
VFFRQCHFHFEKGFPSTPANLREGPEIDAKELPLARAFLPDGELSKLGRDTNASAVSLSKTPDKYLTGRFVFPELRGSRDRRCFQFFKDHISADPQSPHTLYGSGSSEEQISYESKEKSVSVEHDN